MSKHFPNNLLDLISFTSEARQIPNFFVLIYIAIRLSIAILQRIAIHTCSGGGGAGGGVSHRKFPPLAVPLDSACS